MHVLPAGAPLPIHSLFAVADVGDARADPPLVLELGHVRQGDAELLGIILRQPKVLLPTYRCDFYTNKFLMTLTHFTHEPNTLALTEL